MADVFVSYSWEDRAQVTDITRELKALGVTVWQDQDIRAGARWMDEIDSALQDAKVLVLCISPRFLESDWCKMEIGIALSRARAGEARVVPILLSESAQPQSTPLDRFQTLDARRLPAKAIAAKIKGALEADA